MLIISENLSAMGGYRSGRHDGPPTVEDGLRLDINDLLRKGFIQPGGYVAGTLQWTNRATGEEIASIAYEASVVDPHDASVRDKYNANGIPQDYRVRLTNSPCHYGGARWWWRCPLSGKRAAKLYLPVGASVFACRQCYGLAYQSQRETALDRSHRRLQRLCRRLGGEYEYLDQIPPTRPKGMHCKTYTRLKTEFYDTVGRHDWLFFLAAATLLARHKPTVGCHAGRDRCHVVC